MNSEKTQFAVLATTGLIATGMVMFVRLASVLDRTELFRR